MRLGLTPLIISGSLAGAYFFIKLGIGLWTGSIAVISHAFHTFSTVGGVLIALFAQRLGERLSITGRGHVRAVSAQPSVHNLDHRQLSQLK